MLKSKILLLFVLAACFFNACKSDPAYDKAAQLVIDDDIIAKQLAATGEVATKDPSGLYYQIIRPGEGRTPVASQTNSDTVSIHYVGRTFLKQTLFDSTSTNVDSLATKFELINSIEGWQRGIPLIKPGGRIRLIVPSSLGYQNRQIDTVLKANTILDFDIQLIKVIPKKIVTTQ